MRIDMMTMTDHEKDVMLASICRALLMRVRQDIAAGSAKDRAESIEWVEGCCPRALITFSDACQVLGWDPDQLWRCRCRNQC